MAQTVSIKIKLDDNFKTVAVDAESLADAIDKVAGNTDLLNSKIVKLSSISQIAEGAAAAMGQLNAVLSDLAGAYATQSSAETRLAQAMRNTMGASDDEIQSIKDLCSAQQQLGVIGDEVQLTAAQELATYLEYSDSLKAIIPVMNDMAAQQYGLGASAESVTQIATMLGKVMNGQTEALSRYGYKFDEAQKQILKYGTEAERAAVLVDVVSESVGGMNEALARTPAGQMQQLANNMGDVKERIGAALQQAMPFVTTVNQLAQGTATVVKLAQAFKAVNLEQLKAKASALGAAAAQRTHALAARALGLSEYEAATATGVLKNRIVALQATMTMGLSLVIAGVIDMITGLASGSRDAAGAIEEVDEASEAFAQTSKSARGELAMYQVRLEDIIKHHKNDADAVRELNDKYGESFGHYQTAEAWYKTLTEKSAVYCRQLGYEAQARVHASKLAELQLQKDDNDAAARELAANGGAWRRGLWKNHATKAARDIVQKGAEIDKAIEAEQAKFDACTQGMLEAQKELQSGMDSGGEAASWQTMNLEQLTKAISDQEKVVKSYIGVNAERAAQENATLKQMQARKQALEAPYGLGGGGSKAVKDASSDFERYRLSVERAVEVNRQLGGSVDDMDTRITAMRSGLTSLINKYGAENEAVKELIAEYKNLLSARREAALLPRMAAITGPAQVQSPQLLPGLKTASEDVQNLARVQANATAVTDAYQSALGALSSTFSDLSSVVGDSAAAWLDWIGNLLSAVAQAIPAIASLTAAKNSEATANTAAMATGAGASVASVPYVGPVLAVAAISSVLAAVAKLPKFASGGLAYGPTLGIFGEYAGASNNPEVIAPLDKLRSLIGPEAADSIGGRVEFHISGHDLEGVLERRSRLRRRT